MGKGVRSSVLYLQLYSPESLDNLKGFSVLKKTHLEAKPDLSGLRQVEPLTHLEAILTLLTTAKFICSMAMGGNSLHRRTF